MCIPIQNYEREINWSWNTLLVAKVLDNISLKLLGELLQLKQNLFDSFTLERPIVINNLFTVQSFVKPTDEVCCWDGGQNFCMILTVSNLFWKLIFHCGTPYWQIEQVDEVLSQKILSLHPATDGNVKYFQLIITSKQSAR